MQQLFIVTTVPPNVYLGLKTIFILVPNLTLLFIHKIKINNLKVNKNEYIFIVL